jgi:hypothetical protein
MTASIWAPDGAVNANSRVVGERFVATAGQVTFNLTQFLYAPNTYSLSVYADGVFQTPYSDVVETSQSQFQIPGGVPEGTIVTAIGMVGVSSVVAVDPNAARKGVNSDITELNGLSAPGKVALRTAIGAADDADVVKLTSDQTVAGVKTFTSSPVVPAPTTDLQAATKKYVDDSKVLDTTRINVGSASTVNLTADAPNTRHINITGTTTITGFTVAAGLCYLARFAGSLTLTNNAGIVTQTGANIVTQAGDTCILRATAANTVEVVSYVPAVLNQQTTRSMVRLHSLNGYGSTNNKIRRFTTVVTNQGSDITYADSATLGATFTINAAGVYAISYSDNFSSASEMGISLNSAQLTTSFTSITDADRLAIATTAGAAFTALVAWVGYLASDSVIRAHTTGLGASLGNLGNFTITRVA